jgi:hypothetical protein
VPEAWFAEVIIALPPNELTVSRIRSSSVATYTSLKASDSLARLYVHMTRGNPFIGINGFPGSRVDPYRAGIMQAGLDEFT